MPDGDARLHQQLGKVLQFAESSEQHLRRINGTLGEHDKRLDKVEFEQAVAARVAEVLADNAERAARAAQAADEKRTRNLSLIVAALGLVDVGTLLAFWRIAEM